MATQYTKESVISMPTRYLKISIAASKIAEPTSEITLYISLFCSDRELKKHVSGNAIRKIVTLLKTRQVITNPKSS